MSASQRKRIGALVLVSVGVLLAVAPWAIAAPPPGSVSISWVGDIVFSRDKGLPRHPASVFRPVRRWLHSVSSECRFRSSCRRCSVGLRHR